MIKNKALQAMIIGTCIFASSMVGVYADTNAADTPVSIQIEMVDSGEQVMSFDPLTNRQNEIDEFVFKKNAKVFEEKRITVTNTGVVGEYVEIGITPFNEENAQFVYDQLGRKDIKVVEGTQAVTLAPDAEVPEYLMYASGPAEAEADDAVKTTAASPIAEFFGKIWEWIKSIF